MPPRMAILAVPAALVVAGLVYHSWKTRGRRETAFFFLFALLFGVVRGNVIWWITTVHFEGEFPYHFTRKLIGVFHDSLVADMGWILCLYTGAYLAFCILERVPALKGRLFAAVSLACLFNAALSYAVESTAIEVGWWGWTLSTQSEVLRDVPMEGIVAWFSVGFDFLVPYFLIRHYRRPGELWPWLSLLIFPLHMLTHLSNTRVSDALPLVPYNLYHWGMVLFVMFAPFTLRLRLRRAWIDPAYLPGGTGSEEDVARIGAFVRALPLLGAAVVLAVLLVSDLLVVRSPGLVTTKASFIYFVLFALPIVPAWTVLLAAVALAAIGGHVFWAPLMVPGFYFALRGYALWPRFPLLRLVYLVVPIALTWSYYDWALEKHELDRQYRAAIVRGVQLAGSGELQGATAAFDAAIELKPYSIRAYENLSMTYVRMKRYDEALQSMEEVARLRPVSPVIQENLGNIHMLRGELGEAERAFQRALELRPKDPSYSRQKLEEIRRLRASRQDSAPQS